MNKAKFFRKLQNVEELENYTNNKNFEGDHSKYSIIKVVEMANEDYKEFSDNLLKDRDFVIESLSEQEWFEEDGEVVLKCILVKENDKDWGILVHSSGFNYPRYTAIYKEGGASE